MVQTTTTTSGTSDNKIYEWQCPFQPKPKQAEQGWECPRCGRINAPWVRQCDCSRDDWTVNWTANKVTVGDMPGWQKEVTCHDDNVMNNPTIYQVGGSDYKEGYKYVNVPSSQCNNTQLDIDNLQKQLDKLKEIK